MARNYQLIPSGVDPTEDFKPAPISPIPGLMMLGIFALIFVGFIGSTVVKVFSPTPLPTATETATPSSTPTNTPTQTPTLAPTNTPTQTSTRTPTQLPHTATQLPHTATQLPHTATPTQTAAIPACGAPSGAPQIVVVTVVVKEIRRVEVVVTATAQPTYTVTPGIGGERMLNPPMPGPSRLWYRLYLPLVRR